MDLIFRFEYSDNGIRCRAFQVMGETDKCYKVRNFPPKRVPKAGINEISCSAPEYPMWTLDAGPSAEKHYRKALAKAFKHTLNLYTEKCHKIEKAIRSVESLEVDRSEERIYLFSKTPAGMLDKVPYMVTRRTPDTIDVCAEFDDIDGVCNGVTGMPISGVGKMALDGDGGVSQYVWVSDDTDLQNKWTEFKNATR